MTTAFRDRVAATMQSLQDAICAGLTAQTGDAFREDRWDYSRGEGGGRTRVIEGGHVFEKAGVNWSGIAGSDMPASALAQLALPAGTPYFATGVSLVLHPWNPHVPTIHMNVRYFEAGRTGDTWWFGGGIDLSPVYPQRAQVIAFHRTLKATCDRFGADRYARCKELCDRYFYLPHRGEMRGVGGIFFDHLRDDRERDFAFTAAVGATFLDAYLPLLRANTALPYGDVERSWQLLRRGRYVEFNLLYDRGTKFGLESGGRTASILMSLPATAQWRYDESPPPGPREAELIATYLQPQDWAGSAP